MLPPLAQNTLNLGISCELRIGLHAAAMRAWNGKAKFRAFQEPRDTVEDCGVDGTVEVSIGELQGQEVRPGEVRCDLIEELSG